MTLWRSHLQIRVSQVASTPRRRPHTTYIISILPSRQVPPFRPVNSSSRSVQHAPPRPALPSSPFTTISASSKPTPNSSVHAFRVHNSRPPLPPLQITPFQPASTMQSDVIDLTMEDTEDDSSVSDMLVSVWFTVRSNPGSRCQ